MTENITFGKTTAPALRSGRSVEPNPFDGHFPTAVQEDGTQEALTITLDGNAESNKEKVTNLTGKARRAAERLVIDGKPHPMTARVQVNEEGTGKNAKTVMVIWTVEKIKRQTADQTADGQPATE